MPDLENSDLPARTFILSTMVVRLCGTGLIEFPPALCSLGITAHVTWVCPPRYGGPWEIFFGGEVGAVFPMGVGVAFRQNNS